MLPLVLLLFVAQPYSAPQKAEGGFESLTKTLAQQATPRRNAAQAAWTKDGPAYLEHPARGTMEPLLAYKPEIQEPILHALGEALAHPPSVTDSVPALLQILDPCLNQGGAAELLLLLPQFPQELQAAALRSALAHGGPRTLNRGYALLQSTTPALQQAALESLFLYVPAEQTLDLLPHIQYQNLDLESFGAMLDTLALRSLPEAFHLPAASFTQTDPAFLDGLVIFLTAHPHKDAENFLLDRVLNRNHASLSSLSRTEALKAYETGAAKFRWRVGVRQLARSLKDLPRSPLSLEIAWTLHRLGEKSGRNYLLSRPQAEAKRTPDDWRAQFALGKLQVEVGEFPAAYRSYKKTLEALEGTPVARRIEPMDYLYAARAAAGAKHSKESGQWLIASRMRPEALAAYRNLPEFQPYLKKAPFNRLFMVAD